MELIANNELENTLSKFINLEKTIDNLVKEIKTTEFDNNTITKAKITMTLTLINMSIKSISRLHKITEYTYHLEDILFNENKLNHSIPIGEAIELYQLATQRSNNYIQFISSTLNSVRWDELEGVLLILARINSNKSITENDTTIVTRVKEVMNLISEIKQDVKDNNFNNSTNIEEIE